MPTGRSWVTGITPAAASINIVDCIIFLYTHFHMTGARPYQTTQLGRQLNSACDAVDSTYFKGLGVPSVSQPLPSHFFNCLFLVPYTPTRIAYCVCYHLSLLLDSCHVPPVILTVGYTPSSVSVLSLSLYTHKRQSPLLVTYFPS